MNNALIGKEPAVRRLKRAGIIAGSVAIALAAIGIGSRMVGESQLNAKTEEAAIPTVAIVEPSRGLKDQELILPGDMQAYFEAPIYARVSGYLKEWSQDIGAHVTAGQLLGEIDTPDLDQQLHQAEADLAAAQASAKLADLTSKRWQALLKTDSVSQQEADEKAGSAEAKQADAAAAQANVNRLLALEGFKRITAPFDGIVTARETDVGALINAGSGVGPVLFKVADIHRMRIYVRVPQAQSERLVVGEMAELHLPGQDRVVKATVVTTAHAIDQKSRTMLVELQADNSDGTLRPGTYVEVHFKLPDSPNVVSLPSSSLIFRKNGLRIATIGPGDKVVLKAIEIGQDLGTEVTVVSGLSPDDQVIDSPPDSLASGDIVRPADPVRAAGISQ
jgi:RND family efflux transporter MFP subunit